MTKVPRQHDTDDLPVADDVVYLNYQDERYMHEIEALVAKDLSEPYSVFTYRYFLQRWPDLCVCVFEKGSTNGCRHGVSITSTVGRMIACIICKGSDGSKEAGTSSNEEDQLKGYIAMITVDAVHRKKGIGMTLATIGNVIDSSYQNAFPCKRHPDFIREHQLGINRMIERYGCQEIELETEVSNVGKLR